MVHPDDSTLLAYNGQQLPAKEWSSVQQHLALCETCQQRCAELKRTTDLLTGTLAHFQRTHYYPPLAMSVLERIQNPSAARLVRQQRRQERLREDLALGYALSGYAIGRMKAAMMYLLALLPFWLKPGQKRSRNATMGSIPVAGIPIVGFLVVLAAFVVLAYSFSVNGNKQFQPSGETITSLAQRTPTIVSHPPTAELGKVVPAYPMATVTQTPGTPKPMVSLCSKGIDKAQSRIRFCGSNFTAGDQVQLVVYIAGRQPGSRHVLLVNAQGTFQDWWVINDCKLVPNVLVAENVTAGQTSEVAVLQNIPFPHCVFPTSLPSVSEEQIKR